MVQQSLVLLPCVAAWAPVHTPAMHLMRELRFPRAAADAVVDACVPATTSSGRLKSIVAELELSPIADPFDFIALAARPAALEAASAALRAAGASLLLMPCPAESDDEADAALATVAAEQAQAAGKCVVRKRITGGVPRVHA